MTQNLKPIPGYDGAYSISPDGRVFNKKGAMLKVYPGNKGNFVELYHLGQREKVPIRELLRRVENPNENIRID